MEDSAPSPLFPHSGERKRIFRFDPAVSMGSLLMMGQFLVGAFMAYGIYSADREKTHFEVEQLRRDQEILRANSKETSNAVTVKLDQVQATLTSLSVDIGIVKARK